MKKLIPALAMLLVAAALMGTSTYAWFSANENVTASGMSVKAAADGGLAIASYKLANNQKTAPSNQDFVTNATMAWSEGNETVKPVSLNHADGKWYTASADENTSHEAKAGTYKEATALVEHVQHSSWQVKSLDATANQTYTLKVKGITIDQTGLSAASADLNKSLRVALKVDNAWYVFAPLADGTGMVGATAAESKYYYAGSTAGKVAYADGALKLGTKVMDNSATPKFTGEVTYDVEISTTLGTTAKDIEMYVYYEGEDANCKTQFIPSTTVDTLNITIAFSAVKNANNG